MPAVLLSMRRDVTGLLALAVLGAAVAAIVGAMFADGGAAGVWQWLHWIGKPLATLLLLGAALFAWVPVSARYRRWMAAGLAFSLLGDVLLMLPQDLFVPGLLAFLCGHLCFITAFLGDSRLFARPLAWLACLALGAVNVALLWSSIPAPLHAPVAVYALVLSAMGGQAIARAWQHGAAGDALALASRRAAWGAAWFMLSDSLLAWNRFHGPLAFSALAVLGSYYAALWCMARSVAQAQTSIRKADST